MVVKAPPDTSIRRNPIAVLAALPLFEGLDQGSLVAIAAELEWFGLPGGAVLFEEGDAADALYIVTSGALGAFRSGLDGRPRLIGRITAGETVGEMALISGKARAATVRCLRDSELVRFSKQTFDALAVDHPRAMLRLMESETEEPTMSTFAAFRGEILTGALARRRGDFANRLQIVRRTSTGVPVHVQFTVNRRRTGQHT